MIGLEKSECITPSSGRLAGKGTGNSLATARAGTQKEAVAIARQVAKNQHPECFTHSKNGQIRARESYGSDPFPPHG